MREGETFGHIHTPADDFDVCARLTLAGVDEVPEIPVSKSVVHGLARAPVLIRRHFSEVLTRRSESNLKSRMIKTNMIGAMSMASSGHRQKHR